MASATLRPEIDGRSIQKDLQIPSELGVLEKMVEELRMVVGDLENRLLAGGVYVNKTDDPGANMVVDCSDLVPMAARINVIRSSVVGLEKWLVTIIKGLEL